MTTTHSSAHVGVDQGATVTRIYWAVPGYYTTGEEFATRVEALEAALNHTKENVVKSEFASTRVVFDERWTLANPKGGGIDLVIERTTYETIEKGEQMLALAKQYAPTSRW